MLKGKSNPEKVRDCVRRIEKRSGKGEEVGVQLMNVKVTKNYMKNVNESLSLTLQEPINICKV